MYSGNDIGAQAQQGTRDGNGASDHDQPYRFGGQRPCAAAPFPFSTLQYGMLLVLRGRLADGQACHRDWPAATIRRSVVVADDDEEDGQPA